MQSSTRKQASKSPNKTAGRVGVKGAQQQVTKKEEPKPVDTRSPEEIDASFRKNLSKFEESKRKFEQTFARKVQEFA